MTRATFFKSIAAALSGAVAVCAKPAVGRFPLRYINWRDVWDRDLETMKKMGSIRTVVVDGAAVEGIFYLDLDTKIAGVYARNLSGSPYAVIPCANRYTHQRFGSADVEPATHYTRAKHIEIIDKKGQRWN